MSRLTRRVRSDVPPMILKLLNLEEVPTECIEVVGTNSKPCDEVCEENQCSSCGLSAVFEKLAHYEDLEEQGRLIELPCKVGDTVYIVWSTLDFHKCKGCVQDSCENCPQDVYEIAKRPFDYKYLNQRYIYTSKEEAEAKLAELKGE